MHYKKDTTNDLSLVSHGTTTSMMNFSITLSKKCERLATAIYLVTNFLSDTEPMKARLRILSLDFVRDASLLKNGSRTVEVSVLDALRANIGETLALLELALVAGLVSEMNFTLLKREYMSLRDMIDIKKSSHESLTDNVLGDNFFGSSFHTEENILAPATAHIPASSSHSVVADFAKSHLNQQVHVSDAVVSVEARSKQSSTPAPAPIQNSKFLNQQTHVSDAVQHSATKMSDRNSKVHEPVPIQNSKFKIQNSVQNPRAITDDAKESRRASILKLIKDNREVAIGDIVNHFPGLSEKTIQRELVTMSDSGVLKKRGERRWSRYSLV